MLYGLVATIIRIAYGWKIKNVMMVLTILVLAGLLGLIIASIVLIATDPYSLSGVSSAKCSDE